LDYDDIVSTLNQFSASGSDILFVHSSLSACGQIMGGPATVIGALLEWNAGKTLAVPTHGYCYPDDREDQTAFQVDSTPSQVGAITEYFRQQRGVVRSIHPSHSLACLGPKAHEICDGHDRCGTPCGPGTPYERLVNEDASILMFGAPMSSYTLFHTAEDAAGVPYAYYPHPFYLRIAQSTGELRELRTARHSRVPRRFVEIGDRMEAEGLVIRHRFGRGTLRLIPSARAVHRWLVAQLARDPWFLVDRALASGLGDA
jgi:aminoglycoside 3-N-acetyltransferase